MSTGPIIETATAELVWIIRNVVCTLEGRDGTSRRLGDSTGNSYDQPIGSLQVNDIEWIEAPPWLLDLPSRMKAPFKQLGIAPRLLNAGTDTAGTVIIGAPLLSRISASTVKSVVAHEFGHSRFDQSPYAGVAAVLQGMILLRFVSAIRRIHPVWLMLYWDQIGRSLHTMMRPTRRYEEYGADAIAAEYLGNGAMIAALWELGQLDPSAGASGDDHPSITNRIVFLLLSQKLATPASGATGPKPEADRAS